jgi:hypothetical protein
MFTERANGRAEAPGCERQLLTGPAAGAESQLDAKKVNPPHKKGAGMPMATPGSLSGLSGVVSPTTLRHYLLPRGD